MTHDWWIYRILSGAGARFISDAEPGLLYRQHPTNQIGANDGFGALVWRLRMMLRGTYGTWNAGNLEALSHSAHRFTAEHQTVLQAFIAARQAPGAVARLQGMVRAGVYRQTMLSKLALYFAALTKRL